MTAARLAILGRQYGAALSTPRRPGVRLRHLCQRRDLPPQAGRLPLLPAPMRRRIVSQFPRQVGPGAAGALHVEDGLDGLPVVGPRASTPPASGRQQRRDPGPLVIREPRLAALLCLSWTRRRILR